MPPETHRILRLFRIFGSVVAATLISTVVASALWSDLERHITYRAAAPLFLLMFLAPFTFIAYGGLTALLFGVDRWQAWRRRRGLNSRAENIAWPVLTALGSLSGFFVPFAGVIFLFLFVYWLLTGRLAGGRGWSVTRFGTTRWDEKLALVVVGFLLLTNAVPFISQEAMGVFPAKPGTPPYAVQYDHQMNARLKAALRRFPDPQSCLDDGADANIRADLQRMDWDLIANKQQAEVCIFRLLSGWGDIDDAESWLEAQGFRVHRSGHYFEGRDGTVRIDASWPSRTLGPRFPTSGFVKRLSFAYSISIHATYAPDGQRVLFVGIGHTVV